MINSQSGASPVLRAGEQVTTSITALQSKNAKTYYHSIPGARFVMPDGLEIIFLGGQFSTEDKELIAELDKVAGKPASMIVTKKELSNTAAALLQKVAAEAAETAGTSGTETK